MQSKIFFKGSEIISSKASYLKSDNILQNMKDLAVLSAMDLIKIEGLDVRIKNSIEKFEKGMKIRTPAVRAPIQKLSKEWEELLIVHMARSSALISQLWDRAYKRAGKPNLNEYKSFRFPFEPEFVKPNYF